MNLQEAVTKFVSNLEGDGVKVDITNLNLEELKSDIQDEYDCGADGSYYDVISDLYDSVGLEDYGIIITVDE